MDRPIAIPKEGREQNTQLRGWKRPSQFFNMVQQSNLAGIVGEQDRLGEADLQGRAFQARR